MLAIDTETTGLDFFHGSMPYYVSTCDQDGNVVSWEWDIDPLTRKPIIPEDDLDDLREFLSPYNSGGDWHLPYVFQNSKFDVRALSTIACEFGEDWLWEETEDTMIAHHALFSNKPHNLTYMAMQICGLHLKPYDDELRTQVLQARRWAKQNKPEWKVARVGDPTMPSVKETAWKVDGWLPRAIAKDQGYPDDHPWWTCLSDYADSDAEATALLWKELHKMLRRRKLMDIYRARMNGPRIAYDMETVGVTVKGDNIKELRKQYHEEAERAGRVCVNIAEMLGHELELPKSGNNKQLISFATAEDGLNLPSLLTKDQPRTGKGGFYGKSGDLSLNAGCLTYYRQTLTVQEPRGIRLRFLNALADKRKRDTALLYMDGYERFWIPIGNGMYILHPSLNPTGSNTLRWSSSNPNEQNISKKEGFNLRYGFGPAPGREWWSVDAKNIELRIPGYESGQQELIDLFEKSNEPPYYGSEHLLNFSTVYPDIWAKELKEVGIEKVGPHCKEKYKSSWYQWCKNGGFAVGYGAVYKSDGTGTADRAFHRPGCHKLLKVRFAKKEALNQKWIKFANQHGYVETIPDCTVDPARGYPIQCTRTEQGNILATVPLNYHVQGTAMWWTMKAMIRTHAWIQRYNASRPNSQHIYLIMQIHDELVFDLPFKSNRGNTPIVNELIAEMEKGGDDIGIPTPCSASYHPNHWSEEL